MAPDHEHFDLFTVVGNRPQFIKMAALSAALAARSYHEYVVHTGQHFDDNMSRVFFEELALPQPDINLDIAGGGHGEMTGKMLIRIEQVLLEKKPHGVIVYGDTNSTLAAAIAAVKLHIPLAHVEAGPRIYDMTTPEEVNRVVADIVSTLRFCPDELSVRNLAKEGITTGVHFTGDVMFDAFLRFSEVARAKSTILARLGLGVAAGVPAGRGSREDLRHPAPQASGLRTQDFALLTVHRPNNTDTPEALDRLMRLFALTPLPIIFPMHPRSEQAFKRAGLWDAASKSPMVRLMPAVGYLDMLQLVNHAAIVLTDSGGLQKEAFYADKPCITLFTTPWPEIEKSGWQLCAWKDGEFDAAFVASQVRSFRPTSPRPTLFGDGRAAEKIVEILEHSGWLDAAASGPCH